MLTTAPHITTTKMRTINEIIIHCTATPFGKDYTADDIRRWHIKEGKNDIAYHFLIHLDGTMEMGRPLATVGAHTKGHNVSSVGIAYVGGLDMNGRPYDTRTLNQKTTMDALIFILKKMFPKAVVYGHRDFAKKDCPCFDAKAEYYRITQ